MACNNTYDPTLVDNITKKDERDATLKCAFTAEQAASAAFVILRSEIVGFKVNDTDSITTVQHKALVDKAIGDLVKRLTSINVTLNGNVPSP